MELLLLAGTGLGHWKRILTNKINVNNDTSVVGLVAVQVWLFQYPWLLLPSPSCQLGSEALLFQ